MAGKNPVVTILTSLALTAIASAPVSGETSVTPPVTIKELMVGAIEPASNALWAIALEENEPKTAEQWKAVEHEAIQLLAATSAMSLGGSGPSDKKLAQHEKWQEYSRQMAEITMDILKAVRDRNYEAAMDASNFLIEPCGACHSAFPMESR
ncbi:hypothetical protein F6455_10620 [Proteobacteria bacterium 005FR1]|nr:hypothetical protein [Proteobacteria bacterium 005FR1]